MPSEGFSSCPLCNCQFKVKKTGHDATKYLEYEKRKQEIEKLTIANKDLLSTTTKQISELKRQLKDKEREIESLKKRQSHEQKKNVPLGNTKIQKVGEKKSPSKSTSSSLRASKTNLLKTNLLKKNEITRKKTLSPLSKNMKSKEKQTAVKLKNHIQKVSKEKSTLLQQTSLNQKKSSVKSSGYATERYNIKISHEQQDAKMKQLQDGHEGNMKPYKDPKMKLENDKLVNVDKKSLEPVKENVNNEKDDVKKKEKSSIKKKIKKGSSKRGDALKKQNIKNDEERRAHLDEQEKLLVEDAAKYTDDDDMLVVNPGELNAIDELRRKNSQLERAIALKPIDEVDKLDQKRKYKEEITTNLPTINEVDEPKEMTHKEEIKKQVAELLDESGREQQQRREEQNVNPDVPRPQNTTSNKEFSKIQLNEQSKSDNINYSSINLNSNIANEVNMR